jgi:hypothetical protein
MGWEEKAASGEAIERVTSMTVWEEGISREAVKRAASTVRGEGSLQGDSRGGSIYGGMEGGNL